MPPHPTGESDADIFMLSTPKCEERFGTSITKAFKMIHSTIALLGMYAVEIIKRFIHMHLPEVTKNSGVNQSENYK